MVQSVTLILKSSFCSDSAAVPLKICLSDIHGRIDSLECLLGLWVTVLVRMQLLG